MHSKDRFKRMLGQLFRNKIPKFSSILDNKRNEKLRGKRKRFVKQRVTEEEGSAALD